MRVAPLDLIHPDIALERFDYSRIGSRLAVVRLVTRMRTDVGLPADPRLVVDHGTGDSPHLFPARACRTEQRLQTADGGLLWRGAFAMPAELVEHPDAAFALYTGDELALLLPVPRLRAIEHRTLQVRPPLAPRPGVLAPGQVRRRAVALATAAALTTTSTPAVALASSGEDGGPASTTPVGAPATTTATAPATTPAPTTTPTGPAAVTDTTATTDTTAATTPTSTVPATPATATSTTPTVTTPAPADAPTATTPTTSVPVTTTPVTTTPVTTTPVAPAAPTATVPVTSTTTTPTVPLIPKLPTTAPVMKVNGAGAGTHTGSTGTAVSGQQGAGTQSGHGAEHRDQGGDDGGDRHGTGGKHPGHGDDGNAPTTTHRHHDPSHGSSPTSSSPATTKQDGSRSRAAADRRLAILNAGVRQALAAELKAAEAQSAHSRAQAPAAPAPTTSAPTTTGFTGPAGWTGTVSTDPTLTGAVRNLSALQVDGDRPPSFLIPIYMQAARKYHLPWQVLAAINSIESDYGRNLNTSSAGAVGWMQFEPSTWKQYGVAADGHSIPNPYDPRDAIFAAARYLQAAGGSDDIRRAVFAYNHADWYVDEVMQRAQTIAQQAQFEKQRVARHGTVSVYFATGDKRQPQIRYRGSVMSHYDRLIASANMVSAANFPYLWGGGHESSQARFGPFDCSGAVSYVMQQAGYKVNTSVSGDIGNWNLPTGPGRVTIFYNTTHTFMRIGNRFFGTSGFARPGGGAGWFDVNRLPASYLDEFQEVHVPKLGVNSFSPKAMRFQLRHELALHLTRLSSLSPTRTAQLSAVLRTDRA
jgi:membrane-bound lytic murein transglycosylase B